MKSANAYKKASVDYKTAAEEATATHVGSADGERTKMEAKKKGANPKSLNRRAQKATKAANAQIHQISFEASKNFYSLEEKVNSRQKQEDWIFV